MEFYGLVEFGLKNLKIAENWSFHQKTLQNHTFVLQTLILISPPRV